MKLYIHPTDIVNIKMMGWCTIEKKQCTRQVSIQLGENGFQELLSLCKSVVCDVYYATNQDPLAESYRVGKYTIKVGDSIIRTTSTNHFKAWCEKFKDGLVNSL